MRRLAIALIPLAAAGSALATAPCFDACHLAQGQPLLAGGEIWVRPCKTVKKTETCTIQRLDLDGRVTGTVAGDAIYDHSKFEKTYLGGKPAVRLNYGTPWTDLKKPYTVSLETATMTLRLRKGTLVCERTAGTIERPLGCTPSALSVRTAGIGQDSKPEDPTGIAVVIATCGSGTTTRDVIAVCQARP
jgi:hypothetical protein